MGEDGMLGQTICLRDVEDHDCRPKPLAGSGTLRFLTFTIMPARQAMAVTLTALIRTLSFK